MDKVAPYGGAWIETSDWAENINCSDVAPYGGAWIETVVGDLDLCKLCGSLPMGERGLKLCFFRWAPKSFRSLPMGERGLKRTSTIWFSPEEQSLPMGERGLKQCYLHPHGCFADVAPYGGAWIETSINALKKARLPVASYGGAWIETWPYL